jgi:replicative DNA helicase
LAQAVANPLEQIPPHDEAAEQSVLGAMLTDSRAAEVAAEMLVPDDFYLPRHQLLFKLFAKLGREEAGLDLVFVQSELERQGLTERVGGREVLGALIEATPTAANIERYCRIVRDRATERTLIQAAGQIMRMCQQPEPGANSKALLERAEKAVYDIADARATHDSVSLTLVLDAILSKAEQHVEARRRGEELPTPAVPTGFANLDEMFAGGMWPGEVVIIAARPGGGKTTLGLNIALNAALYPPSHKQPVPVALFSMEMPKEQIAKNMLCREAAIPSTVMRTFAFQDDQYAEVKAAAAALREAPVFIDDMPGLTPAELRARARRLRHRHGVGLIVIDYLQLMRQESRFDTREQEVASLSREVKQLARELEIPVVLMSQLRRPPQGQEAQRPTLSDLRESGAIEQDADVVVMLHQDLDRATGLRKQQDIWVIVQKNRNGPIGDRRITYFPDHFRFETFHPEIDGARNAAGG